ncbi:RagB/SusD family nutrient uptake outer membrane protein [Sphingobacterium composti Ten et al. 2007 non Yoo et al. 2007]|uniref:RagB/SusD family nutrient uptake outer membrane protein n=1 Tax=Sphingobacterium composti TaxID=363260 RepID=UPI0013582E70|nr:RagB/SusD family nutrient uptake outer membrane protein [Sphingobacterium composti Ten et al. 2007 non Yoo et al. 2007]
MNFKHQIFIGFLLLFCSCQKWLNVTPSDQFSAEDLYSSQEGYIKALNGIYLEMTDKASYGEYLSCGPIDVLAHYYHINPRTHNHKYNTITEFKYEEAANKEIFSNIWLKSYSLIANCNVLLEKMPQESNGILKEPFYSTIKGEALALRAYFHFDMLRLFGPMYNKDISDKAILPYALNSVDQVQPLVSYQQYLDYLLKDLNSAIELLENDPIRIQGVRNQESPNGDNFLYFRQYRMNYFAMKSILARVYLYKKDNQKAYEIAKDIIQEAKFNTDIFPFVTKAAATSTTSADRVFSTEVIFSLYHTKKIVLFNDLFSSILPSTQKLSFNLDNTSFARVTELYDDENDYRRAIWQLRTDNSQTSLTNVKYEFNSTAPSSFMLPLIRISELYLILAETSLSLSEATDYLNIVRSSRNAVNLYPTNIEGLNSAINKEYRKEFIGEGQMFFFLKRTESTTLPQTDQLTGTANMFLNDYLVPLPDNEISIRNQ